MRMFDGYEKPYEIIVLTVSKIDDMGGMKVAFPHNGQFMLYSGPDDKFFPTRKGACIKLVGNDITNGRRTADQKTEAGWTDALRIDDTPVGDFLFVDNNLYTWFDYVHRAETDNDKRYELVDRDAKEVMTVMSALFVRAAFGHARTAVCGANRSRVFYETEIPNMVDTPTLSPESAYLLKELVDNKKIETINSVPAKVFKALYEQKGVEAVYQRICLTELRERWLHAHSTANADDYTDYVDRLEVHRINQYETYHKHHSLAGLAPIYQDLIKSVADRTAARTSKIDTFKTAKASATAHIYTPTKPSPLVRVAGIPGVIFAR